MKRITLSIFLVFMFLGTSRLYSQAPQTYFLYPTAPESITDFRAKSNFVTYHFWDNCNLKSAFSSRARMKGAFEDFVAIAVYSSPDTARMAVDRLIAEVRKNPKNMLTLGEIAEETLFSDSCTIYSEELFYPFAQGVADTKKIPQPSRLRFERQAKILGHTQVGMTIPDFSFVRPDGSKGSIHEGMGKRIILFFNDPDCDECALTKVRLSADYNLAQLIEKGYLNLYSIYPGEPGEEWKESVKGLPEEWVVGAAPDVDDIFDLTISPTILYIDPNGKILSKTIDKDRLLDMLRILNTNVPARKPKKITE